MSAAVPIWRGAQEIVEAPDSPQLGRDNTRFSVFRIYEGPYDQCVGNAPVKGNAFTDLPAGCLIVDVRTIKKPGNIGRIEVRAETSGPSDTQPYAPTFEIEWRPVEKKLETHTRYATGGAKELTLGDFAMLQIWDNEPDPRKKYLFKFTVPKDASDTSPTIDGNAPTASANVAGVDSWVYTLTANAQDFAGKKLKGIESYRVFYPVARQTKESTTVPSTNPCNVVGPPSIDGIPGGYIWISSAWRGTKTGRYGKWEEQLEYEGNDSLDTDLYPPPP